MSGETWNLIRIGKVVGVDTALARVTVHFAEMDLTSDPLPVLQRSAAGTRNYWIPQAGDSVVCVFYSDGTEEGCVIGAYYQAGDPPPESGAGVIYTRFPDGSLVKWDNGKLTVTALGDLELNADAVINGDVLINGSLNIVGTGGSGSGAVVINAPGGVTVTGATDITGNLTLTGEVSVTGNMNVSGVVTAQNFVQG